MKDVILNMVGVVLHEEAEELQDEAEHLHLHRVVVRLLGRVHRVGEEGGDED